ncbi:MAG: putative toxin-antitoxin system toxin component, PIN family [Pyrinomonadaceae bacterium]
MIYGKIILCISTDILFEYREILAEKTNADIAENVVNFLTVSSFTEKIEIYFNFDLITADASDNKFVDCAIASNADCIVSNDRHFHVLKNLDFPNVTVLTLLEFEERYRAECA